MENIIKEVVQEKEKEKEREGKREGRESREEGALLGKKEEEKGMYTRKGVEDVIERYLVNYVVEVGEGKKHKISRINR